MSSGGGHALLSHAPVSNKAIIRSVFRKHNHNDHLTGTELRNILIDLELPKEIFTDESIEALMLLLDADGSGNVDFEEFFTWWAAMCGDHVETLDASIVNLGQLLSGMKNFTENNHGTLEFPSFAAMWEYCGNDVEPVKDVFDTLDTDGNGSLTFKGN
jgi:Ca2+-binding EF-hand superfamily protein